jgi:hypothetical protein
MIGAGDMIDGVISAVEGFRGRAKNFDIEEKTTDLIWLELEKNLIRLK